jgi:serine protease
MDSPSEGTWSVEVWTYGSDTWSGVTLTVQSGSHPGEYSGIATLSGGLMSRAIYTVDIPSGVDYASFTTSGGTLTNYGANLAVRYNAMLGQDSIAYSPADCYSFISGNNSNCFIYNPTAGTWYVSVFSGSPVAGGSGNSIFDDTDLSITWGDWQGAYSAPVVLSGDIFDRKLYTVTIPSGMTTATFTLGGGTETSYGANLAVRYNAIPGDDDITYSPADCYSVGSSNTESCVVNSPTAGTWYILVFSGLAGGVATGSASTYSNVTLTASWN